MSGFPFETDGKMPELERGFKKAETDDWTAAIDLFQQATEAYSNSDVVHKAYYNLGVSYLYTDQFGQARTALEEAYARKAEKRYKKAVEQLDVRIEDKQRLEEQGQVEHAVVIVPSHPSTARENTPRGNDLESWYIHFGLGLGYGNNMYPYEDDIEDDSLAEFDHNAAAIDLGLYLPRSNRTLVGVVLNGRAAGRYCGIEPLPHSLCRKLHALSDRQNRTGPFHAG